MAATSLLARLGLRMATLGSAASLAIAAPIAEGDVSQAAHTHAARTGVYFPTASSIGVVTNGAERLRVYSDGGVQIGGSYSASPGAGSLLANADSTFNGVRVGRGPGNVATNTVIGNGALADNTTGATTVAIGYQAAGDTINGNTSVVVGYQAALLSTDITNCVIIGSSAMATSAAAIAQRVCIGSGALAGATGSVSIGYLAGAAGSSGVLIGASTTSGAAAGVVGIGGAAAPTGSLAVAVGQNSSSSGSYAIALGYQANCSADGSIAIGTLPVSVARTIGIGHQESLMPTYFITDFFFGGPSATSGAAGKTSIFRVSNSSGTNISGANLAIQAGRSTGSAAGGYISFLGSPAGVSGLVLNAAVEHARIFNGGGVQIGGPYVSSPGSTALHVVGNVSAGGLFASGAIYAQTGALTDAATINYVATASDNFTLLLTSAVGGTRQLAVPTALVSGMRWVIRVQQPASGGPCAMTFPVTYKFPFGLTPALSTAANAIDTISCYYDGTVILAQVVNSYGSSPGVVITGNSLNLPNAAISTNTALDASHYTVHVDATAGPVTITLPSTAVSGVPGRLYNIKKIDATANAVIIQRSGSDVIDGATSVSLTIQYQSSSVHARTAGGAWDVI